MAIEHQNPTNPTAKNGAASKSSDRSMDFVLFIETNLGHNFAIPASDSDTVCDLKSIYLSIQLKPHIYFRNIFYVYVPVISVYYLFYKCCSLDRSSHSVVYCDRAFKVLTFVRID